MRTLLLAVGMVCLASVPLAAQVRSSDLSRGDRIVVMNEAIHTGAFLGVPSRIVVWLASTMIFLQASSGLLMWLYRSKVSTGRLRKEGVL